MGIVAVFKLVLTPLPVLLLAAGIRRAGSSLRIVGGLILVVLPLVIWMTWRGALDELLWTTFVFPRESVQSIGMRDPKQILTSGWWFFVHFAPWVVGAIFILPRVVRARDRFLALALAWIAIALVLIAVQVLSWWAYHFELLMLPVALLAVAAVERIPDRQAIAVVATGLFLYTPQMLRKLQPLTWQALIGNAEASRLYQRTLSPVYSQAWDETRFLFEPGVAAGPIYVLGNPVYEWLSDRPHVPPIDGWAAQYRTISQWRDFPLQVRLTRPRYFYIARDYATILQSKSPATMELLADCYRVKSVSDFGVWFESIGAAREN